MPMPKFSVVIPAYNVAPYIEKAVRSVMEQTFNDVEIIVINDGSTDNTLDILKKIESNEKKCMIFTIKNGGLPHARNYGLDKANGEYVIFLDGDDFLDSNFFAAMSEYINCHETTDVLFGDAKTWQDGVIRDGFDRKFQKDGYIESYMHKSNELRTPIWTCVFVVKKAFLEKYNLTFYEGIHFWEDFAMYMCCLMLSPGHFVDEAIGYYRIRTGSITHSSYHPSKNDHVARIFSYVEDFAKQNCPERLSIIQIVRHYNIYKFVVNCIKCGYIDEALNYAEQWQDDLRAFTQDGGLIRDRLRCRLLLTRKRWVYKLLA
ncbi:MAG: glycosyltransferase family 2 protein [Selenomonadaceae bacterium]|nr:glycosyltransferase family 2 protein [Selenomonadaceae bacterium]